MQTALQACASWLHVHWLSPYRPQLHPKERAWRTLTRDTRAHLARDLRCFIDEISAGLRRLGGERLDIVDAIPEWFLEGHRKPPTDRPVGRPRGATDFRPRTRRAQNLPAPT